MEEVYTLLRNPIFLSAFFSWLISQFVKGFIDLFKKRPRTVKDLLFRFFWSTGGMPSSHSAVVTSLVTSIGFVVGINSPLFIFSLYFAFLIVRDALGVRRAAGHQAIALNQIIEELFKKNQTKISMVKEIHGHKFTEVFMGILLGFFIAVAFCNL
jgi:acid phosphatase family membrane protein YuiD